MTITARRLSVAMFLLGLAAESLAGRDEDRSPVLADGYQILAADFHVHAFPGDGALVASDLAREARRRHLDVVAITNHNQTLAGRLIVRGLMPADVIVIPGDEVTAPAFHLAVIGVERAPDWHATVPAIAADVHAQGGAVILAHPTRWFAAVFDPAVLAAVDGLEAAHPMMHVNEEAHRDLIATFERAAQVNPTIAPIGSSDFHHVAPIGLCRTFVFVRDRSQAGVIDAVRHGRTVACDQSGHVYGTPPFTAAAEPLCRDAASTRRLDSRLMRGAHVATWAGLLALVLFAFPVRSPTRRLL